jgi:hypothetical protein
MGDSGSGAAAALVHPKGLHSAQLRTSDGGGTVAAIRLPKVPV